MDTDTPTQANPPSNAAPASPAVVPSTRAGMGSILFLGGAAFRVWTPFATRVSVAGEFNQWDTERPSFGERSQRELVR